MSRLGVVVCLVTGCTGGDGQETAGVVTKSPFSVSISSPTTGQETCPTVLVAFTGDAPPPATFRCALDAAAPTACAPPGVTFTAVAPGSHQVSVDVVTPGGQIKAHASTTFHVAGVSPAITVMTPLDIPTFVTGPNGPILGNIVDGSPIDQLSSVDCTIDGSIACGGSANIATGALAFSFANLRDELGGGTPTHTLAITAHEHCAAAGATADVAVTHTVHWSVDSTGPSNTFQPFSPPVVAQPPAGPEGDVTGGTNTVGFTLVDPHTGGNPGDEPAPTVQVIDTFGGGAMTLSCVYGTFGPCQCAYAAGVATCTYTYAMPAATTTGPGVLPRRVDVSATDAYGNAATGTLALNWAIDNAAPSITVLGAFLDDGVTQANTCTDGIKWVVAPHGVVRFGSSDAPGSGATFACTLAGPLALDTTACSAAISATSNGYRFTYGALPDGDYTLTIAGTDAFGNTTPPPAAGVFAFHVDGTPPQIVFESPGPGETVPSDIQRTGAFTFVPDASTQLPTFSCVVDGAPVACTPSSGYPLPLVEGAHHVAITGSDCVGNVATAAIDFATDVNPPVLAFAGSSPGSARGDELVQLVASDAVSNVQTVLCSLDAPGIQPATPCPGLVGLPTLGSTYTGTITLTELSPGHHQLAVTAADRFGHTSLPSTLDFTVSYSDASGHVVVIGNDFQQPGDSPISAILGNAVLASGASAFDRPMSVSLVDVLGLASAAERANAASAICQRIQEVRAAQGRTCDCNGGVDCVLVRSTTGTDLTTALTGTDAVVFLDQNDPFNPALVFWGQEATFAGSLRTFANLGGIVIALDGTSGTSEQQPNTTFELVRGLVSLALPQSDSGPIVKECESADPLALGTPESFAAPPGTVSFLSLERGTAMDTNEVFRGDLHPVVIDKYLPARSGIGPAYVRAYTGDAVPVVHGRASFAAPDGTISTCALHSDGTVSHEVAPNTAVTIIDDDNPAVLETLYDVAPYDDVAIGPSVPGHALDVTVSLTWPAYPGTTVDHYVVSPGCGAPVTTATPGATVTTSSTCASSVLISARDAIGDTIGYLFASFTAQPDPIDLGGTWTSLPRRVFVAPSPLISPVDPFGAQQTIGIGLAIGSVVYDSTDDSLTSGFAMRPPTEFSTIARTTLDVAYSDRSSVGVATTRDIGASGDVSVMVPATELLPRITSLDFFAGTLDYSTSQALWSNASTSRTIDDASAGVAIVQLGTSCQSQVTWALMFTPSAHASELALPALPSDLGCAPNVSAAGLFRLEMRSDSGVDAAAAHRAMFDLFSGDETARALGTVVRTTSRF